jgi:hypothetical protein
MSAPLLVFGPVGRKLGAELLVRCMVSAETASGTPPRVIARPL